MKKDTEKNLNNAVLETDVQKFARLCREAIPEGITLIESDGALPFSEGEKVASFGRGQFEYVKSGTGSGGRVNCDYVTTIEGELKKRVALDPEVQAFYEEYIRENPYDVSDGWQISASQRQPIPAEDFVIAAAKRTDKAMFTICRICGESYDSKAEKGDWYLSDEEEATVALLAKHFKHLIVLINGGNLIDLSWVKKYSVGTVAFVWQGGQEGGAGTVDALMGDVTPSGRLADTVPCSIESYPCCNDFGDETENVHVEDIYVGYRYFETFDRDAVLYPFGYGLSYTEFTQTVVKVENTENDKIVLDVCVKNIGKYNGKEVVQVYYEYPLTELGAPARQLVAFKKTKTLAPDEEELIKIELDVKDFASYDDSGVSGVPFAYVMEAGEYNVYVGKNVRDAEKVYTYKQNELRVVKQCRQCLAPTKQFDRLTRNGYKPVTTAQYDINERIKSELPTAIEITGDCGITLQDVSKGKNTLDEFIAQFDEKALSALVRGEGMSSPKAPVPGTASCFAGVTKVWNDKGVPVVTTCDGPSGVRMESSARATCLPTGSLIASSWNPEAFEGVFDCFADELAGYDVDVILAPGVNVHRYALCGRNFEYYSEDPCLAGAFAAKFAERFTKKGVYATLKHFAVNSQETNRCAENEVLSERAVREIYLNVFERAIKTGYVRAVMTSYNRVNGVSTSGSYDLTTSIMRKEWGYDGMVMSDWWPNIDSADRTTFNGQNLAEMVKAQNDVFMVVKDAATYEDNQAEALKNGLLTVGELQRSAKNILRFTMETLAFKSGRLGLNDDLEAATEKVFESEISDETRIGTKDDIRFYQGKEVREIYIDVEKESFYCAEFTYKIDGDPLVQHSIGFSSDGKEPTILVLGGTNGKVMKTRAKLYLKPNSQLLFPTNEIRSITVYKI